jgi:hypothetical protein
MRNKLNPKKLSDLLLELMLKNVLGVNLFSFLESYNNDFTSIIDIYFYETFSTPIPK